MHRDDEKKFMKRAVLITCSLIMAVPLFSQYLGGIEDGVSVIETGQVQVNEQQFYCTGGFDDGTSMILATPTYVNIPSLYCTGGFGDGQTIIDRDLLPFSPHSFYCSSAQGDGFDLACDTSYMFNSALCYGGGTQDGTMRLSLPPVTFFGQAFYLSGGAGDGTTFITNDTVTLNNQQLYLTGGASDGFSEFGTGAVYVGNTSLYATGGIGDGFHGIAHDGPIVYSLAWLGGAEDGSNGCHLESYSFSPSFFCLGGPDDGAFGLHQPATYFAPGAWLGTISTAWENPLNWSGNEVPSLATDVLIPAGKPCYPLITSGNLAVNHSGVHFCKSLTIQQGASLVNKSNLYIYGDMTVSGIYQGDDDTNDQVYVYPGGNLVIVPPGQMRIGKP